MKTEKTLAGLIAGCIAWTLVITDDPKHHKPHIEQKTSAEVGTQLRLSTYDAMTITASGSLVSSSTAFNIEWAGLLTIGTSNRV